jgi:hypothetical protein
MRAKGFAVRATRRVSNVSPPKYTVQFSGGASRFDGVAFGVEVEVGEVGVVEVGVVDGGVVARGGCDEEEVSLVDVVAD